MFRAINDIFNFIPETKKIISLDEMKIRYKLNKLWSYYKIIEGDFCRRLNNMEIYKERLLWQTFSDKFIIQNRRKISLNNENFKRTFDCTFDIANKKIILFGSGKNADHFLDKYGDKIKPEFIVDNNNEVWNTQKRGIIIKSPNELSGLILGTFIVIITIAKYAPIVNQLNEMGFSEDNYRIFFKPVDDLIQQSIINTMTDDKYNIGYVTGAFDLFHIGHLNLLKNCKTRSHYLIAGVLTDEIIINEKHKTPFIPFEERIEIVKQCRYVDRVIAVDSHNTNKLDAWKELKYGCIFSGSDHANSQYWPKLRSQLRSLGSNAEIFPYTQSTSSTMLQKVIEKMS